MSLIQEALRRKDEDGDGDKGKKPVVPPPDDAASKSAPKLAVKAPSKRSKAPAKVAPAMAAAEAGSGEAPSEAAPELPSEEKKPASRMGLVIGVSVGAAVIVIGAFAGFMLMLDREPENELVIPSRTGSEARPARPAPAVESAAVAPVAEPVPTAAEERKPEPVAVPPPVKDVAPSVTVEVAVSPKPTVESVRPAPVAPAEKAPPPVPAPVQKAEVAPAPLPVAKAPAPVPVEEVVEEEVSAPLVEVKWPHLKIVGTMAGQHGGGSAIINGTIVSVDDRVEGVRLLEVSQTACVFEYKGETQMVRVGQTTW